MGGVNGAEGIRREEEIKTGSVDGEGKRTERG